MTSLLVLGTGSSGGVFSRIATTAIAETLMTVAVHPLMVHVTEWQCKIKVHSLR